MASSGLLSRVGLVRTDISEERLACIFKVTTIDELRTTLAVTSNRSTLRDVPEVGVLHSHRRETSNLNDIKRLSSVAETQCVSGEVRTVFLYSRRRQYSMHVGIMWEERLYLSILV
jgi:hypothetical protein